MQRPAELQIVFLSNFIKTKQLSENTFELTNSKSHQKMSLKKKKKEANASKCMKDFQMISLIEPWFGTW